MQEDFKKRLEKIENKRISEGGAPNSSKKQPWELGDISAGYRAPRRKTSGLSLLVGVVVCAGGAAFAVMNQERIEAQLAMLPAKLGGPQVAYDDPPDFVKDTFSVGGQFNRHQLDALSRGVASGKVSKEEAEQWLEKNQDHAANRATLRMFQFADELNAMRSN
ncbi:MAG: hypothetical protein GJ677_06955 [Rhodobacteraceae bacterium]|nr:hypothetical protein [Paracoccaceae bacterium]